MFQLLFPLLCDTHNTAYHNCNTILKVIYIFLIDFQMTKKLTSKSIMIMILLKLEPPVSGMMRCCYDTMSCYFQWGINTKLQAQSNSHGHNLNDRIYEVSDQFSINKIVSAALIQTQIWLMIMIKYMVHSPADMQIWYRLFDSFIILIHSISYKFCYNDNRFWHFGRKLLAVTQ